MTVSRPPATTDEPTVACFNPVPPTVDPSSVFLCVPACFGGVPSRIGHYQIARELGRGGMGVVYEGYDARLKRTAAIKMIRDTGGPDAVERRTRFQTEAEAVAQLHHPNIVQIYEVGSEDGRPYVALEYLAGGSLLGRTGTKPQPPRPAAEVVRVAALAMHHAHEHGVVHRDLKPANILFDAAGNAKVTDFGAARVTYSGAAGGQAGSALTRVGEVIGTPQYMAPEQARGTPDAAGPAIDIYALGAMLYQQLTGRPPFDGPDPFEILRLVTSADPLPPRQLVPQVPHDLETICLKCLEKQPTKRYRTAADLADDLGRYLAGATIRAKPATAAETAWKKARQRPAEAALLVGIVLVALAGLTGVIAQWQIAVAARNDAETNAVAARLAGESATEAKVVAERERDAAATAETAAAAALDQSRLALAANLWEKGEVAKAESLVAARPAPGVVRDWEWHNVRGAFDTALWEVDLVAAHGEPVESQWVSALAVSPDGLRVVVSAWDPYGHLRPQPNPTSLYLIRLADGRVERVWRDAFLQQCSGLAWQSNDRFVSHAPDHVARVWDVADENAVRQSPPPSPGAHRQLVLSPDGRTAVWPDADGSAVVWDATTGRSGPRLAVPGKSLYPSCVGGGTVAAQDERHVLHVFDAATGAERFAIPNVGLGGVVSPDGRLLVAGTVTAAGDGARDGTAAWDAATGQVRWRKNALGGPSSCFIVAPDGRHVVDCAGGSGEVRVWHAATGEMGYRLRGHRGIVNAVAISPDGRTVATAADDCTVLLWNIQDGAPVQTVRGHRLGVRAVAFAPDGSRLVTGGGDGRIFLWDLTRQSQAHRIARSTPLRKYYAGMFGAMAFTPGGRLRVADTQNGLTDFDPATVNPVAYRPLLGPTQRHQFDLIDWAFTPDARRVVGTLQEPEPLLPAGETEPHLAVGGGGLVGARPGHPMPGVVAVWDGDAGTPVRQFDRVPGMVFATAISPDGALAAAFVDELRPGRRPAASVFVWDVATGKVLRREEMPFPGASVAFSPDSRTLVAALGRMSADANIVSLDLAAGTRTDWPATAAVSLRPLAFSPDGKWLAGSCWKSGDLIVWEVATHAIKWQTQPGAFTHLAFSPNSRRLATVDYTGTVTLWESATGREAYSLAGAKGRVMDHAHPARLAFSADGVYLAANQHDGTVYVWAADANPSATRRQADADAARFGYHTLMGWEAAEQGGQPFAVRFHLDRLQSMTAPTDALRQEYDELQRRAAGRR